MTKNVAVEKKTQAQYFAEIAGILNEMPDMGEYVDFLNGRIELLENQAARAKERKAAKVKPEDALLAAVEGELNDKLKTGAEITEALEVEFPEVTKAKVINRLTKLVKDGVAGKIQVKVGDGKRVMAYALAEFMPSEEEDAE